MPYPEYDPQQLKKLEYTIDVTFRHTGAVLENLKQLLYNPSEFNRKHGVTIPDISLGDDSVYRVLPLLAFIHDFYKIVESPGHAAKGAKFISRHSTRKLVEFHDLFGVISTGEASFLFLNELVEFTRSLKSTGQVECFLNELMILTLADIAAYGFLNQPRIHLFHDLISLLKRVPQPEEFTRLALADTPQRIARLLKANNRIEIHDGIINEEALQKMLGKTEYDELRKELVDARFDAGIYVLEPLFRYFLLGENHCQMSDKTPVTVGKESLGAIQAFVHSLRIILHADCENVSTQKQSTGNRILRVIDLNEVSIKEEQHVDRFLNWISGFKF